MTFCSTLIKAIKNPKLVLKILFYRLKPYHAVVITFKFKETKNVRTPATIYRVTNDNIDDALIYEPPINVDKFRQFLKQGDWGYYAYIDDQWVHRSWVTFGPQTITQWDRFANLKLSINDAGIRWCETSLTGRGNNVYPAVLSQIARDISKDFNNVYGFTTTDNIASFKGLLKAGFFPVKKTTVYSFFGIKYERMRQLNGVDYKLCSVKNNYGT
ncbi:hypothetical protein [Desulfobacterium sp. N47]|uniref:N-acetyltransferase domain-containing protein n=1 Tax=uncultured Desulfobacterium sp. TaxID=201089 RepID=E1YK55_9BACT|nr:unknown protein [uncultured Desulfobacterium sp.]